MPFSAPTGFMVPPLHGVSSAVSCSGTLDQGSLFRFRVHSNYSVVVVIWTFVVRAIYTCHVIGVRCCKAWDIHPVLKNKNVFFFQILVLSYERFISLPFFSHYPGDGQSREAQTKADGTIIFCMQTLLDLLTSRVHPPWTLSGLCHDGQHRMGILNTSRGRSACWRHPCWMFILIFFSFN